MNLFRVGAGAKKEVGYEMQEKRGYGWHTIMFPIRSVNTAKFRMRMYRKYVARPETRLRIVRVTVLNEPI